MNGNPCLSYAGPHAEHMNFAVGESAAVEASEWERWAALAEALLGHDLDGDDSAEAIANGKSDGYSMDTAFEAWERGESAEQHVAQIRARQAEIARHPLIAMTAFGAAAEAGRAAITVEAFARSGLNGQKDVFWFDQDAANWGMPAWSTIEGVDPLTDSAHCDVWFTSGKCLTVVNSTLIYLSLQDLSSIRSGVLRG
ncbi:MAG: DUF2761 domain-containing protein [Telluria sp.]